MIIIIIIVLGAAHNQHGYHIFINIAHMFQDEHGLCNRYNM